MPVRPAGISVAGYAWRRAAAAGRGNEACLEAMVLNLGSRALGCRLRRLRLGRSPVPLVRLGQVADRGVPGLVVPLGGARVGVPHGALEIAERPVGIEVQRRE